MARSSALAGLIIASLALAGCGVTPGCRAVSTGALGAGTGAVVGAIVGAPIAMAAVIGGAAGAITGAASSPRAAYLGPSPVCY
jgi:osmotically inducible lipoprotein OsmB